MRGLTLTQPWATLVVLGEKRVETRSWQTAYRGSLLIHAAKRMGRDEEALCLTEPFLSALKFHGIDPSRGREAFPLGCALGLVTLNRVESTGGTALEHLMAVRCAGSNNPQSTRQVEEAFGNYGPGRYAWLMTGALRFEVPIPCRGALSLWYPPIELQRIVRMSDSPML